MVRLENCWFKLCKLNWIFMKYKNVLLKAFLFYSFKTFYILKNILKNKEDMIDMTYQSPYPRHFYFYRCLHLQEISRQVLQLIRRPWLINNDFSPQRELKLMCIF